MSGFDGLDLLQSKVACRAWVSDARREGDRIAFVPTMGALHEGHASLIRLARERAERVIISVFLNPLQFGPNEDLSTYPKTLEADAALAKANGADAVFTITPDEMYPQGFSTKVEVTQFTDQLCGKSRPGHFEGVTTVVAKLFNIVQPDLAVFGRKDFQQVSVILRMVRDLDMPVEILVGPTHREPDGLAMSSRNTYLNPTQRQGALCLYRAQSLALKAFRSGERDAQEILARMRSLVEAEAETQVDYIEAVDTHGLSPKLILDAETTIAMAVKVGSTRLIDNIDLGNPELTGFPA